MVTYSELRKLTPIPKDRSYNLCDVICLQISPIFSKIFIKHRIIPNMVTIYMIIFGIIGAILLAIPNNMTKIISIVFFYLWYTMDCCDGEVARYTKNFSKYGKEMDFMAHLTDHVAFNFALWFSLIEIGVLKIEIVSGACMISISCELLRRNLNNFSSYLHLFQNKDQEIISIFRYIYRQLNVYPNFILFFCPIVVVAYWIRNGFSVWIFLIWTALFFLDTLRAVINYLFLFFRAH